MKDIRENANREKKKGKEGQNAFSGLRPTNRIYLLLAEKE